ncbi:FAD-binding protein [Pseudogemmatithrix spongiicola]|uniref:FAD-binding protein n=1 Tax=Pseudogemmatithrix spongiicola TaxID=3062599 RepID=A0AA49Q4E4_9BACT|nr:FAD-binding protein [Gemmatimonadaceae bacterium 'strain 138']WKW14070.1 FAD-binding protein [Gemmatimonadaceae bacterium 'strain 318']
MSLAREALHPHRVEDVADIVRDAVGGLRIRGAGSWMHVGAPVVAAHELRLDAFRGVRHYTPGDLTISVGAGTTLAEIDAATAAHGQWCPLLPWGDDRGSVGAAIATATGGPFAEALGRPRDLVLGLECVDGRGRIVRAGGRVVKNVAGFDLTRLMVGSWGTLAVITEVHLRLRARPSADVTLLVEGATTTAMRAFQHGALPPLAALPLGEATARTLGHPGPGAWLLRLGGNAPQVAAARQALARIGACIELGARSWDVVRHDQAPPPATHWTWTPLMKRVREAFDPRGVLNPGLLGEAA